MKTLKKGILMMALLASVGTIASCGGNKPAPAEEQDLVLDPNWEGEITWWSIYAPDPNDDDSDNWNYASYWYTQDVKAAFEAANPKIKVKIEYKGTKTTGNDYVGVASAVSAGIPTGNIPNMVTTYGTYVVPWMESNVVYDVTAHGKALEEEGDVLSGFLSSEKDQYGGNKYYSLPYSKSTEALMVNHEVFAARAGETAGAASASYAAPVAGENKAAYEIPGTFTEMMEVARKMKQDYPTIFDGSKEGEYIKAWPCIYEGGDNLFYTVMKSAGIDVESASKEATKAVLFNNQKAKDVIIQLKKYNNEGLICTANQLPISSGTWHKYPSAVFDEGRCFMIIASTAGARYMANDGYSVDWAAVPKWNSESAPVAITQGGSIAFFNKQDKNEVAASLKFYDFLTNSLNSAKLATSTSYLPLRASSKVDTTVAAQTQAYEAGYTYETDKNTKIAAYNGAVLALSDKYEQKNAYFMSPVNTWSYSIRSALKGIIDGVFNATATTDEEIATLVNNQFQAAYNRVFIV